MFGFTILKALDTPQKGSMVISYTAWMANRFRLSDKY
jgi:hypothetical protein